MIDNNSLQHYRGQHACWTCRKSFSIGIETKLGVRVDLDRDHVCPECRNPMAFVGPKFKPPRRNEVARWGKLERSWKLNTNIEDRDAAR